MIKHSADVNARDKNWQTPLHVAAANKAVKCAEVIIPLLSSVNVSDRGGRTALHHAALNGHVEVSVLITGIRIFPTDSLSPTWNLDFITEALETLGSCLFLNLEPQ